MAIEATARTIPRAAVDAQGAYSALARRRKLILGGLLLAVILSLLTDVALGPARYSWWEVVEAIISPSTGDLNRQVIIWEIRLPIALLALVIGAALAIAGAEMQTILNNPMASPFTLGVSAAASLGAALALVLGVSLVPFAGPFLVAVNAFVFALLASAVIYLFSRLRGVTSETMVLLGIALVFLCNALLALLQYIASEQALQQVVFWTLGSLSKATWGKVGLTTLVLTATAPLFVFHVWKLTALRLGDDKARSMGIDVARLRLQVLLAISLLAAVSVAFVGTIGFVGLVGPHVARMLVGEDQRYFLPTSALAGALLLSVTSIVSKSIIPGVLIPVGIITALVGVPFFLTLILTKRRQLW